jgi:hypothetical protein
MHPKSREFAGIPPGLVWFLNYWEAWRAGTNKKPEGLFGLKATWGIPSARLPGVKTKKQNVSKTKEKD